MMRSTEASAYTTAQAAADPGVARIDRPLAWGRSPEGRRVAECARPELCDLIAHVVHGAFPGARFALYVWDSEANLTPVLDHAPAGADHRGLTGAVGCRDPADGREHPVLSTPVLDASGEVIGVIAVERGTPAPGQERVGHEALAELAMLIAPAVQRTWPHGRSHTARRDLDFLAACRLQPRLMSGTLPEGLGVTALVEYRPALGVGGDFYSLRHLGDRRVSVAVGDVSGTGVSAALLASRVASDVERALAGGETPSEVLALVNEVLIGTETELFVAATCLQLDVRSRTMKVANAGQPPLVIRHASGDVLAHGGASGTPLGIERCPYLEDVIALEPEDIVVLATDGLFEALDEPTCFRGSERVAEVVRRERHDLRALHARLREAVDEASRTREVDDVTWIAFQITA